MSGIHLLIGTHAALGEVGALCFLWALVDLVNGTGRSWARARTAAWLGCVLLFASWAVGGYYYVVHYGPVVKPVIKAGAAPWAHSILIESKEHLFIFIPLLALCTALLVGRRRNLEAASRTRRPILVLCGLVVLMAFAMAGFGFLVSTAARTSMGGGV